MNERFLPSGRILGKYELMPRETAMAIYLKYLWLRVHKHQFNTAIATTGDTGSGKTRGAILKGYILNPRRFNETCYVNSPREFLQAIDDSRMGDSIVWDEVGVSMSSRKWQSLSNILTAETLQTYRVNKLTVFFCLPDLSFCDVQARKLMTIYEEVKRSDTSMTRTYTYRMDTDRKEGKIWFKAYRMILGGRLTRMPTVEIPSSALKMVPKEIWDAITEKETEFKSKTRKRSLRTIEMLEKSDGETGSGETIYDMINKVQSDLQKYTTDKGKLDLDLISVDFGVGETKARQVKKWVEKTLLSAPHGTLTGALKQKKKALS